MDNQGEGFAFSAGHCHQSGAALADRLLFAVAALAAEMERVLIRERPADGLRAAAGAGRHGGRPTTVTTTCSLSPALAQPIHHRPVGRPVAEEVTDRHGLSGPLRAGAGAGAVRSGSTRGCLEIEVNVSKGSAVGVVYV